MKKPLTLVIGFLVVLGVSSCTKEYYDVVPNQTFVYTISPNQWVRESGTSNRIFAEIDLPELTDYYVDQGIVSVAASFDDNITYDILPTTFDATAYSVNYTTGLVTIYAEDPILESGIVIDIPTVDLIVKVTLSDADLIP